MPRKGPNLMQGLYRVTRRLDGWYWACVTCPDVGGPYRERHIANHAGGGHYFFVCGREKRALIDSPLLDKPMIDRDGDTE